MKRMIGAAPGLLVLALSAGSCDEGGIQVPEITELPRDLAAGEEQLIEADNRFGLKLFRQVTAGEEAGANVFISPLSVGMALGMAYNGAAGTTRQAMQEALELQGLSLQEVNESYRSLIDLLAELDPSVQWTLANSIWHRDEFTPKPNFIDLNVQYFDAEVAALDFTDPAAPATINAWVDDKTNGRISEIVGEIPAEIVMFLINAVYFKGNWTAQFDPDLTAPADFHLADGSTVQVPMMTHGAAVPIRINYGEGVLIADLPYGGKAYAMTIVLPDPDRDLDALIASLDAETWNGWVDGLGAQEMHVFLPKFTLEYEVNLNDALKALGMGIAFDPNDADFSGIADAPLYISRVKHKTFVDVNEEGTEAAAVTSVEVGIVSVPPELRVDRPFLFAIRERFSGTVLFLGVVRNPS